MRIVAEATRCRVSSSHQFEEEIGAASSENGLLIAKMEFSVQTGLRRHAFKEDMAMHEPNKSRDVSALIALVNAVIEYWKEIARRNFVKANPQAEPSEFERRWPKALANLLLAD